MGPKEKSSFPYSFPPFFFPLAMKKKTWCLKEEEGEGSRDKNFFHFGNGEKEGVGGRRNRGNFSGLASGVGVVVIKVFFSSFSGNFGASFFSGMKEAGGGNANGFSASAVLRKSLEFTMCYLKQIFPISDRRTFQ